MAPGHVALGVGDGGYKIPPHFKKISKGADNSAEDRDTAHGNS